MARNLQKPQVRTLIASGAITTTGTASAAFSIGMADSYTFILNVTAISGTSPTLDAVMQTSLDGGTTYVNVPWRFTQVTTSTGSWFLTVRCGLGVGEAGAAGPAAATGGALATPTVVDPNFMKLAYTLAGTSPSFTLSLTQFAMPPGSSGIS